MNKVRFKVRFKYDIALTFNWHFYLWTDLQPSPFFRHPKCYTSCYTLAIQRPCIFWALAEIIHFKYNGVTQFTTYPRSWPAKQFFDCFPLRNSLLRHIRGIRTSTKSHCSLSTIKPEKQSTLLYKSWVVTEVHYEAADPGSRGQHEGVHTPTRGIYIVLA